MQLYQLFLQPVAETFSSQSSRDFPDNQQLVIWQTWVFLYARLLNYHLIVCQNVKRMQNVCSAGGGEVGQRIRWRTWKTWQQLLDKSLFFWVRKIFWQKYLDKSWQLFFIGNHLLTFCQNCTFLLIFVKHTIHFFWYSGGNSTSIPN